MISNIEEIKQAADVADIVGDYLKLKHEGQNLVVRCPFHEEKTASFKIKKSENFYKCFGCGRSGDSIAFLMEFKNINYIEAIKLIAAKYSIELEETGTKVYAKPQAENQRRIDDQVTTYFEKRGISKETLHHFQIKQAVEWMPKAATEIQVICFNYYKAGELVNIKFRGKDKDFKLSKNAEPILYNLDSIINNTECVICEGEIDCLSLHEAGIKNVVSVPNGTPPPNSQYNLEYLNNCWSSFEGKDRIIIATDNDGPGKAIRDELARRLGFERCYMIDYPDDCKDMNDVLIKYGKAKVKDIIESAKRWPITGILTMDDLYPIVSDYYLNGYPPGQAAGLGDFDKLLTFTGGQLTVITGSPGSGKSEFLDWISTSLARKHSWKFAILSFENPAAIHVTKIMEKFIGLSFHKRNDPQYRMNQKQFEEAIGLTDLYFSFIDIAQIDITIQGILDKCRELVLRTGIKGIVIDPWNYIEHKIPQGYTETQYVSECLSLIKEFSIRNDVHVFVVAHPRKLQKDQKTGKYPIATMYDISGSAHFFNKTDNGISVHRDFETGTVDVYTQKVRFSWLGEVGFVSYSFDKLTRQYVE